MLFEIPGEFQNDKRTYWAYLYVELIHGLRNAGGTFPPNGGNLEGSGVRSRGVDESAVRRDNSIVAGFFEILRGGFDSEGRLVDCKLERGRSDKPSSDAGEWMHRLDNGRGCAENGAVAVENDNTSTSSVGSVDLGSGCAEVRDGSGGRLGRIDGESAARKSVVDVGTISFGQVSSRGLKYERNKATREKKKLRLQALNKSLQQSWDERRVVENKLATAKAKKIARISF